MYYLKFISLNHFCIIVKTNLFPLKQWSITIDLIGNIVSFLLEWICILYLTESEITLSLGYPQ